MTFKRPRIELEERLTSEYLARYHPRAKTIQRARLGRLPDSSDASTSGVDNPRIYLPMLKWADGLAIYPDHVCLIESKIKLRPDALGQLIVYRDEFKETEEFREHWNKPLTLQLIYAIADGPTERAARALGIIPIRFCPKWARDAYLRRVRNIPDR